MTFRQENFMLCGRQLAPIIVEKNVWSAWISSHRVYCNFIINPEGSSMRKMQRLWMYQYSVQIKVRFSTDIITNAQNRVISETSKALKYGGCSEVVHNIGKTYKLLGGLWTLAYHLFLIRLYSEIFIYLKSVEISILMGCMKQMMRV